MGESTVNVENEFATYYVSSSTAETFKVSFPAPENEKFKNAPPMKKSALKFEEVFEREQDTGKKMSNLSKIIKVHECTSPLERRELFKTLAKAAHQLRVPGDKLTGTDQVKH